MNRSIRIAALCLDAALLCGLAGCAGRQAEASPAPDWTPAEVSEAFVAPTPIPTLRPAAELIAYRSPDHITLWLPEGFDALALDGDTFTTTDGEVTVKGELYTASTFAAVGAEYPATAEALRDALFSTVPEGTAVGTDEYGSVYAETITSAMSRYTVFVWGEEVCWAVSFTCAGEADEALRADFRREASMMTLPAYESFRKRGLETMVSWTELFAIDMPEGTFTHDGRADGEAATATETYFLPYNSAFVFVNVFGGVDMTQSDMESREEDVGMALLDGLDPKTESGEFLGTIRLGDNPHRFWVALLHRVDREEIVYETFHDEAACFISFYFTGVDREDADEIMETLTLTMPAEE